MNYIKHLTGFFDRIILDPSLNPTHISLYISLFQHWNINRFRNPISITRDEVMRISKIASKATYHKCMKDLHGKGFIKYEPSFNPFKGSMVVLYDLSADANPVQNSTPARKKILPVVEQVQDKQRTTDQPADEQALVPSINNTNNSNDQNIENESARAQNENQDSNDNQEQKASAEKDAPAPRPSLPEIRQYFSDRSYSELKAQKFFNYYSSNGWLIGGKSPMVNWHASADNWMLNAPNFQIGDTSDRAKNLHVTNTKNYNEPL
ncbi:MAG: transcriptional regulator [Flavobacterium sp.]|nr:MAG: transcriptional regulator [Flavobacterium sp.]